MTAPLIGITTWERNIATALGDARPSHTIGVEYVNCIVQAGGIPVLLVPGSDPQTILPHLDGLLMTGGQDVDPKHYGGKPDASQDYSVSRDEFELDLARSAFDQRLPTLGICRGLQVMNIALGGTLIEDIPPSEWHAPLVSGEEQLTLRHPVKFEPQSALAEIYAGTERIINTIHHQSVAEVAEPLTVVGTAPDGIVEAVEALHSEWLFWGVQWHPEKMQTMTEIQAERRLFQAFISAIQHP